MATGWADGDAQVEKRRNREWLLTRLAIDAPVYDVNNGGTVTATAVAVDGDDSIAGGVLHYTVPAGATSRALVWITFQNNGADGRDFHLYLPPNAVLAGIANAIWGESLLARQTVRMGPYVIEAGGTIQSLSSNAAADEIGVRADVLHFAEHPPGIVLKALSAAAALTGTLMYTCPTSGIRHAVVSISMLNGDTVTRAGAVYIVPNGQAVDGQYVCLNASLDPGEPTNAEWFTLDPGDRVYHIASAASVVGIYLSVIEFAD